MKLLHHPDDIKFTEVAVKKGIPIGKLKLLKEFSNWCYYAQTGLADKEFRRHITTNNRPEQTTLDRLGRLLL